MPPAARSTDLHTCPLASGAPGPISQGDASVLIGFTPGARVGDAVQCPLGVPDAIAQGSPTVLIGGAPAARVGDLTAHGGAITAGCLTVLIG